MQYIIGVDIGTSGTKAIAFSMEGEVIGNTYVSYDPLPAPAGHHELDPEILLEASLNCLEEVVGQTASLGTLLGISFSSFMHGFMAVNENGQPLTNIITWADLRSTSYADALKKDAAGQRIYEHSGTPVHPMTPLCKLIWMKDNEPKIFAAASKFISMKEYLFFKLFGKYLIDHSVASGTGLFDIANRSWYDESLKKAGITSARLSEPVPTTHIVRGLKKEYAERLQLDENTAFIIGASDGCLANMGSNAINAGDMSVTIGTSSAVRMIADAPKYDAKQRTFNYILTDKLFVAGGPSNNGINVLKWYSENFLQRSIRTATDIEWFMQEAAKAPAGADRLIFLPYVQGERAPIWDAFARGVFFGVSAQHNHSHFMRAIVEGVNYALYQIAQSVEETIGSSKQVYASGGFINSRIWIQWLCDLFGKPITITSAADASTTGAAMLGLQAIGILQGQFPGAAFVRVRERFDPDKSKHLLYAAYFDIYTSLYNDLRGNFYRLNAAPGR
jgi:gluconokinase